MATKTLQLRRYCPSRSSVSAQKNGWGHVEAVSCESWRSNSDTDFGINPRSRGSRNHCCNLPLVSSMFPL